MTGSLNRVFTLFSYHSVFGRNEVWDVSRVAGLEENENKIRTGEVVLT